MGLALVLSFLFCFVALQMQMQGCNGCLEKERVGLLEIKASFVAHDRYAEMELASWVDDRASNCCDWDRVKCSNISTGHVTELSLSEIRNYSETSLLMLNVSLFRPFAELLSLNLSQNWYNGLIDNEGFPRLKKLETLDLTDNSLNCSLLPSLNVLSSLRTLKLGWNRMNCPFSARGFPRLKKLETLDLSYTSLNCSILPSLNVLSSLRTLKLGSNWMDCPFTARDFVNFSRLEVLDFSANELSGSLDAEDLQSFKSLKVLDLSSNKLNGSIQGLCKKKDFIVLNLRDNMFSGQLPECLSFLTNLQVLDLSNNLFNGSFSSFASNLTSLEYLSLYGNYLQGSFSLSTLANHSKLRVLYISSQSPRAQIKTEKTQWFPKFQLKSLILPSCNLNMDKGSVIPSFLLYQYDLQFIDLSHNKLVGAFPSWLIQNNSRLETLYLMSNSFVGNFRLSSIKRDMDFLDISNNNVSGLLQKEIGALLPNIFCLNLSMNNVQGNIPASIGDMKNLRVLDLSHNHFSGKLPKQLVANCTNMLYLKLSNNFLEGSAKFSKCKYLYAMYLNSNNFSGTLDEVLANNTMLSTLDISNNSISGAIPCSIGKFSSIKILLMADNQLEGEIPFGFSNMTELQLLDLSQNRLFGSVPYFNLSSLRFLYLQKNNLSGSIPSTLTESRQLVTLDLRDNKFSGNIPHWKDKLSELRVLLLGGNNFHGNISFQLCQLKNITIMDLSRNMINGSIPSCLKYLSFGMEENQYHGFHFKTTNEHYLGFDPHYSFPTASVSMSAPLDVIWLDDERQLEVEFRTKSNYYSYRGDILENMTGLDLSCNKLSGIIPSQIGNLQQIHSLNLSHNYLSGPIPKTFSNLTQIESLDLSYNNLSGEIPSQLTQLNFLSIFNVSYNNLSGMAPSTGQFGHFGEDSYKGNPSLCVPLIEQKCVDAAVPPPSQSSDTRGKETIVDMVAFYWSFTASYVTILLGFITVLCINAYWRMAWFHFICKVIHRCFPTFPLY